jgi:hypothetical protein
LKEEARRAYRAEKNHLRYCVLKAAQRHWTFSAAPRDGELPVRYADAWAYVQRHQLEVRTDLPKVEPSVLGEDEYREPETQEERKERLAEKEIER